ncbi:MAG: RIP metalloprotease RseP [Proteobacteria bacterium]|nr:RIP metalloprotease RseP [Pseudomonadota bacterium]HQR02960.1 RIP metalloprotease RseP [Rhodocyclaceae bacterium]
MNIVWYAGAFLVALGVLVFFHELGHFLAARACGVKVLRFSIGFGRPLRVWRFGRDATEWSLAAIPLGGYVRMLDENEAAVDPAEVHRAFNRQPVSRRALIVVAGPVANLLLAVLLYWAMFMLGMQDLRPRLGDAPVGTLAARAGIEAGELVMQVNGRPVVTWTDLRIELLDAAMSHTPVALDLQQLDGGLVRRTLDLQAANGTEVDEHLLDELGLTLYRPRVAPVVGQVLSGSAAERAGLVAGDRILAIDGHPVRYWDEFSQTIRQSAGQTLRIDFLRHEEQRSVMVTPAVETEQGGKIGRVGIAVATGDRMRDLMMVDVRFGPRESLIHALAQTWDTSRLTLVMMGRMVTGAVSWRNISGPVAIADYAGQSARLGVSPYLRFLALISISLGVLNLLPIPVLDGGHLMYHLCEFFKGRPVSDRALVLGQRVGLGMLGLLMAIALYNDLNRLISG